MKRHTRYRIFVMENLRGLSREVATARRLVKETNLSYSRLARQIGVSKNMVARVLTGRRTSKRVLDGVVEICKQRRAG